MSDTEKTYTAREQMDEIVSKLEGHVSAKVWEKAGKLRIYFGKLGKDVNAYIQHVDFEDGVISADFPTTDLFHGCRVVVFSNPKTPMPRKWLANRRRDILERIGDFLVEAGVISEFDKDKLLEESTRLQNE